jgi:hypothetical protein
MINLSAPCLVFGSRVRNPTPMASKPGLINQLNHALAKEIPQFNAEAA